MTCEHLYPLEKVLARTGIKEVYRGQPWSDNCREWVYYDCLFTDLEKTREHFNLDKELVQIHSHLGTHDGQEHGLVCTQCKDGIMGMHPDMVKRSFSPIRQFE
ncbi:MAG TPA: hypothetical protein VGO58_04775 [Chitinophagaceae bacterium]|jgi:hypothetical protein|nr:hypothetical protein [Chitinophagaceae bacterium]